MKRSRTAPIQSTPVALKGVYLWLFVSSLYYVQTLFSGEFVLDVEEGFTHKFVKYVVCAALSTYLIARARDVGTATFVLILTGVLAAHLGTGGPTNLFATSVLAMLTMVGFSCLLTVFPRATSGLARAVVWSGALVGIFSMVELTILAEKFIPYWAATGGVRSISTLFNPNNLGMYVGAALLLMPWAQLTRRLSVYLSVPLCFALIASGSRTAWVALAACVLVLLASRNGAARRLRRAMVRYRIAILVVLALMVAAAVTVASLLQQTGIESENRGADLFTASIRWTNFLAYLDGLGWHSLLPDTLDEQAHLIQDNVYLVLLNVLGGLGLLLSIAMLATLARPQRNVPREDRAAWRLLMMYFLISGLSGTFLNSFPNNQLFFIALGGLLAPRFRWGLPPSTRRHRLQDEKVRRDILASAR